MFVKRIGGKEFAQGDLGDHGTVQILLAFPRGEFLGLVLNHPEFEWIRALSALIAQMDEWAEEAEGTTEEEFDGIVEALRELIRPEGANKAFTPRYWHLVDNTPDVTVAHVKAWRLVGGGTSGASASSSPRAPGGGPGS